MPFQLFALIETKVKENGEISWWAASEMAREGMSLLLNDV